jgi:hypothetical protein
MMNKPLTSLEEIKHYWANNTDPIYFVSPTTFNLMDLDRWVNNLTYIAYVDTFDGQHPKVFVPSRSVTPTFEHLEEINLYLLGHKEVYEKIKENGHGIQRAKPFELKKDFSAEPKNPCQGNVIFLFFNKALEDFCAKLGLNIWLPSHEMVIDVDSKIVTTQLGNASGVPSVPNIMAKVDSYATLQKLAKAHDLGNAWVIQTAYGDSGKTTFFIANEADYDRYSDEIEAEDQVKVMRRIRCASAAIEGCATGSGTFVGPLMSELIGVPSLTPYQGGWCGNDLYTAGFSSDIRRQAQRMTVAMGDALYKRGYKGYFEIDYLIDLDTDTVYLGELNPRITGITAMTNLSPFCQDRLPLFLFHLLEFSGVPFALDPEDYNLQSLTHGADGETGQLILKYTDKPLRVIERAPVSGVYQVADDGQLIFKKKSTYRRDAVGPDEVFLLQIMKEQEYAYYGGDMAILFVNKALMTSDYVVTTTAESIIRAFRALYHCRDLTAEEQSLVLRYQNPGVRYKP